MKKLVIILVLVAFGFSSAGMTLHVHFCCGRIETVKLVPVNDDHSPVDQKKRKNNCCDDKQVEIKIKADYKNEKSTQLKLKGHESDAYFMPAAAWTANPIKSGFNSTTTSSPPASPPLKIYKTNCIYRI